MKFELSESEKKNLDEFFQKHECPKKGAYTGAIGGGHVYEIVPTTIGTILNFKCFCGERVCLTELWDL